MLNQKLQPRKQLIDKIGTSFDKNFLESVNLLKETIQSNKKVLFVGNGGSAAEAQHMAAEYIATLDHKRPRLGMKAIALTTDTSFITAWSNDFGYESIFERQVETLGEERDCLMAYSTSGTSPNILKAVRKAKEINMNVISFLGNDGGTIKNFSDISFIVPSSETPLIQEVHTMLGHEVCSLSLIHI